MEGEVVVDLLDSHSLRAGMRGVDAVYHMAPNMHPAELEIGRHVISAAQELGVERIVYHSVLHPQIEAMPHHWDKMRVEEAVIESRLRWTILQPAPYVQNFNRPAVGVLRVPYRVDAPFSFVDLRDVAEAAAIVLTGIGFDYGIYELAGPQVMTVAALARGLGVKVESTDSGEVPPRLAAMFEYYDRHGLVGNPAALAMLLGRPPTSALDALLRDLASGYRADH
jgi:uncharacterized protein YbjT (DUF2867 family)